MAIRMTGAHGRVIAAIHDRCRLPPMPALLDLIGDTPLLDVSAWACRPGVRVLAKCEGNNPAGSVKDRAARGMILSAMERGELRPGMRLIEATSGNTGIALAMIGHYLGYKVRVVMPENVSEERRWLLEAYGAEVVLTDGSQGSNGAIRVAQRMAEETPEYFMPYQYGNPANPRAHYEGTGVEIIEDLPEVDTFVAGLGTGGTLMGVGRRLKEHNPGTKVIAVVPHPGDLVQGLRSLEDGFVPPILDQSLLDGRFVVASKEAFATTRVLMQQEGIFAGISAGSAVYAAVRVAHRMERGNVVVLLADGGWKYLSTGLWTQEDAGAAPGVEGKIWW
jgi:cysteine synthase B